MSYGLFLIHFSQILSHFLFSFPPRHILNPSTIHQVSCWPTEEFMGKSFISPSILARRKTFHTGADRRIDQIPLRLLVGVGKQLDERQHGVCSSECFNQHPLVVIVNSLPLHPRCSDSFWCRLQWQVSHLESLLVEPLIDIALTPLVNIVTSCFPDATRASTTSPATSAGGQLMLAHRGVKKARA